MSCTIVSCRPLVNEFCWSIFPVRERLGQAGLQRSGQVAIVDGDDERHKTANEFMYVAVFWDLQNVSCRIRIGTVNCITQYYWYHRYSSSIICNSRVDVNHGYKPDSQVSSVRSKKGALRAQSLSQKHMIQNQDSNTTRASVLAPIQP